MRLQHYCIMVVLPLQYDSFRLIYLEIFDFVHETDAGQLGHQSTGCNEARNV